MLREYVPFKDTNFDGDRTGYGWFERRGKAEVFGETLDGLTAVSMVDPSAGVEGYLRAVEGRLVVTINRLITATYDEYLGELRQMAVNLDRYLASSAKDGLPLSEECLEFLSELKNRDESILVIIDLSRRSVTFFRSIEKGIPSAISQADWDDDISEVGVEFDSLFPGVVLRLMKENGALVFTLETNDMVSDCRLSEFIDAAILREGRQPGVNKCRELLRMVCLTARI